jgi:ABC-type transport auxiliary lipoprotein component
MKPSAVAVALVLATSQNACMFRALGGARIIDYAWYPSAPIDVAVAVNVLAFEVDSTGAATLNAGWALRDPHSRQVGYEGQSAIVEPAGEAAGGAAVASLSRALAQLSREVAVGIVTNTRSR